MTSSTPAWKISNNILHLVSAAYLHSRPDSEPYLSGTFAADGFIHCTGDPAALLEVANRFYRHVPGEMLVLVIAVDRLTAEVKWEAPVHPDGTSSPSEPGHLFPHIYGPVNREAIVEVRAARRSADGSFLSV
jgi:hypothetical protein